MRDMDLINRLHKNSQARKDERFKVGDTVRAIGQVGSPIMTVSSYNGCWYLCKYWDKAKAIFISEKMNHYEIESA